MNNAAPTPPGSPRIYWTCQLLGWGGYALTQFLLAVVMLDIAWPRAALEVCSLYGAGLVLTHLLRRHMRAQRWETLPVRRLAPRILLASLIIGMPLGLFFMSLQIAALNGPEMDKAIQMQFSNLQIASEIVLPGLAVVPPWVRAAQLLLNWVALIALWNLLYFGALAMRRRRATALRQSELARTLQQVELRLLKAQLNPHFLFNSLNSVRALIADDTRRAQDAVTQLSRILRYTLNAGQDELASLEQELAVADDYIALESLRLGERLRVERTIEPAALRAQVPVMLLQTLIENAIKHGIAELEAGGVLGIAARIRAGALEVEIDNPRPGHAAAPTAGGIGLRNAGERLRLLFGASATLELDLARPRHAVARLRVPSST